MIPRRLFCVLLALCCASSYAARLREVADGLNSPLFLTAPRNDNRLFVVERGGTIRIVDARSGAVNATPFLTISDVLENGEQGLLGLAFSPDYAVTGVFYVDFTRKPDGATVIRRYSVSSNPDRANAGSGVDTLTVPQPYENHNGGWIGFGPDGFLYVAMGDGGSGNDPDGNAQNVNVLLGKMLRLEVAPDESGYRIPAGNPFAAGGGAGEIWDYGLRNPWRCSFDRVTGDLWIGDVGQGEREEIDRHASGQAGGKNFGWRVFEGNIRTPGISDSDPGGTTKPVFDYTHDDGFAVTGGYIVRDPDGGGLRGWYVFGDFASGRVWALRPDGNGFKAVRELTDELGGPVESLASFGEDGTGRVYLVSLNGSIYRLIGASGDRPEIKVRGRERLSTRRGFVRLRGRVVSEDAVRRVTWKLAGSSKKGSVRNSRSWKFRVPLLSGENRIVLRAEDANGRKSPRKVIRVTRN